MNKKHVAINTHLILCIVMLFVFLGLSIICAVENEIGLSIMFGMFVLLPIFVFVISPLYFVFFDDRVEIVYHFKQREVIKWGDIRNISLEGAWFHSLDGFPHYVISYPRKQKMYFFMESEISKTRKTKKLFFKPEFPKPLI